PRREELPLLDVDRLTGASGSNKEICLAAKKGRDLQDIDRLRDRCALIWLMHVGRDGKFHAVFDLGEDGERLFQPKSPRAREARAVRLVERAFVDEADVKTRGNLFQRRRGLERMGPAFQHARPRYKSKRQTIAKTGISRHDNRAWSGAQDCRHGRTM